MLGIEIEVRAFQLRFHSNFFIFSAKGENFTIFNIIDIILLLLIDFETFKKFSVWKNQNKICSACWISSALRGHFCFFLNVKRWTSKASFLLKLLFWIHANSCIPCVSVATSLIACSSWKLFSWHQGFDQLSPSFWSHTSLFNQMNSFCLSGNFPLVPIPAGFSIHFNCLHWPFVDLSRISGALFATTICCLLSNQLASHFVEQL